jgi:hypothetical protein
MKMYALSGVLVQIVSLGNARWNISLDYCGYPNGHFTMTNRHHVQDITSLHKFQSDFLYIVSKRDIEVTVATINFFFAVREGAFFYICDIPVDKMNHAVLKDLLENHEISVKQALEFMEL